MGPRLAAYVVGRGDGEIDLKGLHEFARDRLPGHNDVPFAPGAVAVVNAALEEFHTRPQPAGSPATERRHMETQELA